MEDDNGLELSLGLSCGGSAAKAKGKVDSSMDLRTEESDRDDKIVEGFKNFLHGGNQKQQDSGIGTLKSKPKDNFFNDLSKSTEIEEDKHAEVGNKRKSLFEDMNHKKKHERESHQNDLHEKTRTSYISVPEDGSTAENEDVAESEVEGSTSRLVSSSVLDLNGKKGFNGSSDNEFKLANLAYGVPFSSQNINMLNMPYLLQVEESNTGAPPTNPGNMPLTFGYPPVQIPSLDKDNSWGLVSHNPQFPNPFAGRVPPNSEYDGKTSEQAKGDNNTKQPAIEEGSSSQAEEDVKGNNTNFRTKDPSDRSTPEISPFDLAAIKPGIAAEIKFGGSGSLPNLPWVSTTGHGPKGRTISGVTYRYNANQIRIVCACHGSHMSPEEFVRHASEDTGVNPESDNGSATFANNNPAASAQS